MKKAKSAIFVLFIAMAMIVLPSCQQSSGKCCKADKSCKAGKSVTKKAFGKTKDGKKVDLYTLDNGKGIKADIMTYGGIMVNLYIPGRDGKSENVMLGFDNVADYEAGSPYFGALIGRYGNRIANGKFTLDGKTYTLAKNDGDNHLHGGLKGFDKVVWDAEPFQCDKCVGLKLHYVSKDGEEGYPGNLDVTIKYIINAQDELVFEYEATTDKATPVNLTQHNYYNFNGGKASILGHKLMINADYTTPVVAGLIPTGKLAPVKGTPFDFTKPYAIGDRVNDDNEQLKLGGGYDHNWVLDKGGKDGEMTLAADVYDPETGRGMKIYTDQPAIQFYCGNFLDGTLKGHNGYVYGHRYALCLETQHYPDSPNHDNFPSTILRPGEVYKTKTVQKFYSK